MNNKGVDQTAQMRRLTCAFVVRIWHKQVFSWCGSNGSIPTVWNVQWNSASTMLQTDINVEWSWHWILFWRFIKRPLSHVSMAFQSYQRWRIKAFERNQSEGMLLNMARPSNPSALSCYSIKCELFFCATASLLEGWFSGFSPFQQYFSYKRTIEGCNEGL